MEIVKDNYSYFMGVVNPVNILVDKSYQRPLDEDFVRRVVKDWDDRVVNIPKVSLRSDGKYYVFDGQHTVNVWRTVHGDEPILCQIFEGLTVEEEKDLFCKQNGIVHRPTTINKLRAEYNFGDKEVVSMVDSAKLLGFTVDFEKYSGSANTINAVDALYKIYKRLEKDNFINVLTVIRNTWNGDPKSLQRGIILGVAFIYEFYSDKITNAKMIEALKRNTPDFYLREAKENRGSLEKRMAKVMIKVYNYGKRTNRLPEF